MTSTATDHATRSSRPATPIRPAGSIGRASSTTPAGRDRGAAPWRRIRTAAVRGAAWPATWVVAWLTAATTPSASVTRGERAQSTVEYALILLGAAAIALVVVAWVTRSDAIGRLFDTVLARVLQQAG